MRRAPRARRLQLAVGAVCLLTTAVPAATAVAADEPGVGLESFSLQADAPSLRVRQGTESTEAVVPQSLATLRNGGVGLGQSAVVWPGALAGNAGSLLVLAADAPKEATVLDSPVRAEARSGSGAREVVNDDYPGALMRATATLSEVTATSEVGDTSVLAAASAGSSRSSSRTAVTGARAAVAEAASAVRDVSLLGGQVTVGSVVSTARATTDGAKTAVDARTVVTDLRIAGQRVEVGSDGIRVAGQSGPETAPAVAAVNEVVQAARLAIAVSEPLAMQDGGTASITAGSLVLAFTQSSGAVLSVVLGGANVAVAAVPGEPLDAPVEQVAPVGAPGPVAPAPPAVEPVQFDIGTGAEPALAAPALPETTVEAAAPAAAPEVAPVALGPVQGVAFSLPSALSPGWYALVLLGSLLVMNALRRVPDGLLSAAPSTACPLSESR